MNPDQIHLVRSSWVTLAERAELVTTRFYEHLFVVDPGAAHLFAGVDMAAQRVKLAQTLSVVVAALDNLDRLMPAVAALGKRHAGYGVEAHHFDSVGEALLQAFSDTLGDEFRDETRVAWSVAYTLVASVMQRALTRQAGDHAPQRV